MTDTVKTMDKDEIQTFLLSLLEYAPAADAYKVIDQNRSWLWHFEIVDHAQYVDGVTLIPAHIVQRRLAGYAKQPAAWRQEVETAE